jgi:excisionase family DNA binding protein
MSEATGAAVGAGLESLLRIGEVAKVLNVSQRTLERMIAAGAFPGPDRRSGAIKLWKPATVRGWIDGEPAPKPKRR